VRSGATVADRVDQLLAVTAAEVLAGEVTKELRTRMRGLPVMIHTSGLAATCAFLLARADKKHPDRDPYYRTAVALITQSAGAAGLTVDADPHAALTTIARADGHRYRLAETRARELAMWLSRLAQARYVPRGGDEDDG